MANNVQALALLNMPLVLGTLGHRRRPANPIKSISVPRPRLPTSTYPVPSVRGPRSRYATSSAPPGLQVLYKSFVFGTHVHARAVADFILRAASPRSRRLSFIHVFYSHAHIPTVLLSCLKSLENATA
ncbi:hypothetical protein C8R44DRAFT_869034 [Mycena epipterygia]|nr:hypothetical protein C8R44DRAFT_869034 [Mycena epipterygia]